MKVTTINKTWIRAIVVLAIAGVFLLLMDYGATTDDHPEQSNKIEHIEEAYDQLEAHFVKMWPKTE